MTELGDTAYNIGMYIRTTRRTNKDGSTVEYASLAENYWDPVAKCSKPKNLYSFGRVDEETKEDLRRLAASIVRFLSPEDQIRLSAEADGSRVSILSSKSFGGAYVLDELWKGLEIDKVIQGLLKRRKFRPSLERELFALVASRVLQPQSKLGLEDWVAKSVMIPGLPEVSVQNLYRAMDFLLEAKEDIEREVYLSTVNLLNLEVDLIYFDTTSTYFELDEEDDPEEGGLRVRGHSKDHRGDLPQIVVGLAVTRQGIPIRSWVWPGNTADVTVVKEVKDDLRGINLGRVVSVVDRGFVSEESLRYLQRAGGHYIAGEKMRSGKRDVQEALSRPGRYKEVKENLHIKEIVVGEGEARKRYILAYNPDEAEKQRKTREAHLAKIREILENTPDEKYAKAACKLVGHQTYGRYVKVTKGGRVVVDKAKVKREEHLDGKYLIGTSDDTLSAEDVALGYKGLIEIENAFKCLKNSLDLRPIYHRLEDRIRAHVVLCWLALLLIRTAEIRVQETWPKLEEELEQMHVVQYVIGDEKRIDQRTETQPRQKRIMKELSIKEPPLIHEIGDIP